MEDEKFKKQITKYEKKIKIKIVKICGGKL